MKALLPAALASSIIFSCAAAAAAPGELAVEDIVKINSDSMVSVGAIGPKGSNFGSGFVVASNGLIVTNLHIVQSAAKVAVKLRNDKTYNDVRLVKFDQKRDVAVLKIGAGGLKPVVLGDSRSVQAGEKVIVIGNPLGLESTVSDGLVSSIRRVDKGFKVLQITAPVSAGSSGSPLFNRRGEVIGIAVGTMLSGQNVNFAIPVEYVRPLLEKQNFARTKDTGYYTARPGDTLFGLARRFDTTVRRLMEVNNLPDTKILAGQQLRIPD